MAWIYSLSVECGIGKEMAEKVARHFDNFPVVLSDGISRVCSTYVFKDGDAGWTMITTDNISGGGIQNIDDARRMTDLGLALYKHLVHAPLFRFALAGVEVDSFRDINEIEDYVVNHSGLHGLVISKDLWLRFGKPGLFIPFAPDYFWRPYEGEQYREPKIN